MRCSPLRLLDSVLPMKATKESCSPLRCPPSQTVDDDLWVDVTQEAIDDARLTFQAIDAAFEPGLD